ncbi:hypothetical protein M0208_07690 [Sphingomonas sp. SUN019]|uniref:hypothetical protein n=1 Tax=Sphingomonas sp. SUN019 TaxID=2937788 RepID=UPI0021641651|nr:hypothetical protein [Sphingomonas sp. SUN019]UVO50404.1 hypothetical protein M0208_07690 [Sphingomonas sp. SUN019]
MTPRQATDRRIADNRAQYRGPDRRSGTDRRLAAESIKAPEQREGPGLITWLLIAAIGFLLVDALIWNSHYRHIGMAAITAEAASIRAWSDDAWRSAGA